MSKDTKGGIELSNKKAAKAEDLFASTPGGEQNNGG
jgi:hypothetical protein